MASELEAIKSQLELLKKNAMHFFDEVIFEVGGYPSHSRDANFFWDLIEDKQREKSHEIQRGILHIVRQLLPYVKNSLLLTEADERDLSFSLKRILAALRFREYYAWDTEILHNEDVVLGVRSAGQTESDPAAPQSARGIVSNEIDKMFGVIELADASAERSGDEVASSVQRSAKYRPNTAFVMMRIDPLDPNLEDVYNTIKSVCGAFGVRAVRADEIEHEGVITERVLAEIRASEFLIADLTGERPSVYYEIGYAHAIGRRVIMYRNNGSRVHFDLAAYNCPEYRNITDLKEKLTKRLVEVTNRKPSKRL